MNLTQTKKAEKYWLRQADELLNDLRDTCSHCDSYIYALEKVKGGYVFISNCPICGKKYEPKLRN